MDIVEGNGKPGPNDRFAIVIANFNPRITGQLETGALQFLKQAGVTEDRIQVYRVPGAFEIPTVAMALASGGRVDAVICLGAVIRGETAHFDYVAGTCADGCAEAGRKTGVPVLFGVLTTDTVEQALERAGVAADNKGAETARAAVDMIQILRAVNRKASGD